MRISHSNLLINKRLSDWTELIKLEHTVFALPFTLSGFVLANKGLPQIHPLVFTIIAFTGARTAAMCLNRVIDAEIDKRNPRTQLRAIPRGKIKKHSALVLAILALILLFIAASQLPPLCIKLAPIAVIWLCLYSYTKRVSALCHFALGIALGGATLGGWIAAGGNISSPTIWLLSAAVTFWVTGFDIIYGCQDYEFDTQEKIFSMPAAIGIGNALKISRLLHILTVGALVLMGIFNQLGFYYWLGISIVAALLFYEQTLVKANDLSKLNTAFFNTNGIISILAFVFILADHLSR